MPPPVRAWIFQIAWESPRKSMGDWWISEGGEIRGGEHEASLYVHLYTYISIQMYVYIHTHIYIRRKRHDLQPTCSNKAEVMVLEFLLNCGTQEHHRAWSYQCCPKHRKHVKGTLNKLFLSTRVMVVLQGSTERGQQHTQMTGHILIWVPNFWVDLKVSF